MLGFWKRSDETSCLIKSWDIFGKLKNCRLHKRPWAVK